MSRLFGTDGVRGVANRDLTCELAYEIGRAGAEALTRELYRPRILIGRDTRVSGPMLEAALVAGIMSTGADVALAGVLPTPAIAYLTRFYACDAGVMLSASHNPVEYNGIKFFNSQGSKLPDAVEDQIEALIRGGRSREAPTGAGVGRVVEYHSAARDYIDFLKSTVDVSFTGLRLVLDCSNGAASALAPRLFAELGAQVIPFFNLPDGDNINRNCGSTHPERVQGLTVEQQAHAGLAFDGDADRLIACDERGGLLDGDHVLAVCGRQLKREGRLQENTVVGTVMSNMGLEVALAGEEIRLLKTAVGDRYVLENMLQNGYVLGGEKSGHIIFLEHNTTGDGMLTALQLLRCSVLDKVPLSHLAGRMENYPQVLVNITVDNRKKPEWETDQAILAALQQAQTELTGHGRVLVRASGTEPLVRVMLEGRDLSEIRRLAASLSALIAKRLDGTIQNY